MIKVSFVYSWIYDEVFEDLYNKKELFKENGPYPRRDEIKGYIKKVENLWRENEKEVLTYLYELTGLGWKVESINCYVVGWVVPFSDPLTIPMYKDYPDYFIDMLTHELIHNLLIQNEEKLKKYWEDIDKEFSETSVNFRNHVPVHAIHELVYKKIFGEERLKRDQELLNHIEDYRKSWEVVRNKGSKKIVDEIKQIKENKR